MKTLLLSVVVLVVFGGCASHQTVMVNKEGEYRTCAAEGRGLIGASIAHGVYSQCMNEAGAAGFAPLDVVKK